MKSKNLLPKQEEETEEITEEELELLFKLINNLKLDLTRNKDSIEYKNIKKEFENAMDNDFNTSVAISNLFNYITLINKSIKENDVKKAINIQSAIIDMYSVLGLFQQDEGKVIKSIKEKYLKLNYITEEIINNLIKEREIYKKNKDYESADKIRNELLIKNIIIKDISNKTEWDINI